MEQTVIEQARKRTRSIIIKSLTGILFLYFAGHELGKFLYYITH